MQKMLDFDWELEFRGGEVVNAVREVVAPGSAKFPPNPLSSSLSSSSETSYNCYNFSLVNMQLDYDKHIW